MEETVTVQDTTENVAAEFYFQRAGNDRFFIDVQVGDQSFTLYPTREEVDNIRHALFHLI